MQWSAFRFYFLLLLRRYAKKLIVFWISRGSEQFGQMVSEMLFFGEVLGGPGEFIEFWEADRMKLLPFSLECNLMVASYDKKQKVKDEQKQWLFQCECTGSISCLRYYCKYPRQILISPVLKTFKARHAINQPHRNNKHLRTGYRGFRHISDLDLPEVFLFCAGARVCGRFWSGFWSVFWLGVWPDVWSGLLDLKIQCTGLQGRRK